jgi:hypothetical protein
VASNVVPSTSFDTQYRNIGSELNIHQTPTRPNPAFAPFQQHQVAANVLSCASFHRENQNIGSEINMHPSPARPNPAPGTFVVGLM